MRVLTVPSGDISVMPGGGVAFLGGPAFDAEHILAPGGLLLIIVPMFHDGAIAGFLITFGNFSGNAHLAMAQAMLIKNLQGFR